MKCAPGPADGVFGEGAVGGQHFVEGGDAVAGREFPDGGADAVDDAGDVVAGVGGVVGDPFGDFPWGFVNGM